MEIHSTIQFRLILPHIPGFQQMPLPTPVYSHTNSQKNVQERMLKLQLLGVSNKESL